MERLAATSGTVLRPVSAVCRRIISICTRSMATIPWHLSKRRFALSTPWSSRGRSANIGCSNWQAWKIANAFGFSEFRKLARFDTLRAYYSGGGRDLEREIVPLLEAEKVGLLVWSPLAGGLLSGKFSRTNQKPADSRRADFDFPIVDKERTWKILDVTVPIAKAHGCSSARLSLAWLLAKPMVTSVIIGAKRLDQLQDKCAAVELTFTQDKFR